MDPANPDNNNSDVVFSTADRDDSEWFCVIDENQTKLILANRKDRQLDKPAQ